jgi:hypothetical protein
MQLNGAAFDALEYVAVSEQYEKLLNLNHDVMMAGSPAAEEDARNRMRQVLMAIAPDLVEQSDREDEAAERALNESEVEEPEPEPAPQPPSDPPPAPSANVRYLSTRRGADGSHPVHYVKRDDTFDAPPYWPLPKDYR